MTFFRLLFLTLFTAFVALAASDDQVFEKASPPLFSLFDTDLLQAYQDEVTLLKKHNPDKASLSAALQSHNLISLQELYKKRASPTALGLDFADVNTILNSMKGHPIIGLEAMKTYDPTGQIGFCFGRATYVHLELLQHKVDSTRIIKIFAVGGLDVDGNAWDFHVATATQDNQGTWWVIDSLFNQLTPIADWMYEVGRWDANKRYPMMRFYFTNAAKFQVLPGSYDSENFHSPLYQTYFDDLKHWFSEKPHLFICQK